MAAKKSSNAVCFKGERTKEDRLSPEIQRQCEGKMIPSILPMFSIDFAAQDLYTALACHKSPHQPTSLFMKSPFQLRCYTFSSKLIPFSCLKAWNMTMRVRRPLKGTLRKIIWSYVTQSKKVKKTRKPKFFFCSCARKKLNQSRKGYQNTRQSKRRRQNQKRR